ncbi:MAG: discoidin domain-containing protein [Bacteroidales bacterium]|nr:discoidin domain-containing protein [Bacteroidales bacterium]
MNINVKNIFWIILLYFSCNTYSGKAGQADTLIVIAAADSGKTFDGLGAISASSSRLLYDYPEPERSQILDYLFKPACGSALQMLKIEIGSDMNSTDFAEPSHMRIPGEIHDNLGFEWWLMEEAKKRNPGLKLYALAWGAPGWVGETFWTKKNIDYLTSWLDLAHDKGFVIDYIGGWNERGWDARWYIDFSRAVKQRFPHVKIVASDDIHKPWSIASEMVNNRELRDAVDIIGAHSPCGWRTEYTHCHSTEDARSLNKPLWNAEHSSMTHNWGAAPLARAINRVYIQAGIVSHWVWSLASAWYSTLPIADTGLLLAEWPWSGYYEVGKSIWVYAHTTQFTQPGWQYVDRACGFLSNGASLVTYKSPDRKTFSTVIETCDAGNDMTVEFSLSQTFNADTIYVWETHLASDDVNEHFVRTQVLPPINNRYSLTVKPGYIYTVTNTTGQGKGTGRADAAIDRMMPLPYEEDFESYGKEKLARYFCDLNGGYETYPAGGGRKGMAYRQMVEQLPISWERPALDPVTVIGDPRWWGDYEVSADLLLEEPCRVEIIGRISSQQGGEVAGYHLQLDHTGKWTLYSQEIGRFKKQPDALASGKVKLQLNEWHRLSLRMKKNILTVLYDNKIIGKAKDDYHISGQAGLLTSQWHHARFDNFRIEKTGEWPQYVPVNDMNVTATGEHAKFHKGYSFLAENCIDGRPETSWYTEWGPKTGLPQSVTVDLGKLQTISGLVYQPRRESGHIHNHTNGYITKCEIYVSRDNEKFVKVASPVWQAGTSSKHVEWKPVETRYVKLVAVEGVNEEASIGELNIIVNKR